MEYTTRALHYIILKSYDWLSWEAINTYWSLVEENLYKLNTWKFMKEMEGNIKMRM